MTRFMLPSALVRELSRIDVLPTPDEALESNDSSDLLEDVLELTLATDPPETDLENMPLPRLRRLLWEEVELIDVDRPMSCTD